MMRVIFCLSLLVLPAIPAVAAAPLPPLRLHPKARPLPHAHMGPFVHDADGSIIGIDGDKVIRSSDGGATWKANPIFTPDQAAKYNIKVSNERAFLRTAEGALVLACMNLNERKWTWDKKIHDAPGAKLPTWVMRSTDGGATWTGIQKMHEEWTGAVRDMIQTRAGRIIFTSMKLLNDPGRHTSIAYVSDDQGESWKPGNLIDLGGAGNHGGVTEPSVVELRDGRIWMLIRTNWGEFWNGYSHDGGRFYRELRPSGIPASSSPGILKRLADGRLVMAWNRPFPEGQSTYPLRGGDNEWSEVPVSNHRGELSLAFSQDDGKSWSAPTVLAKQPGASLAYPYIFERSPGLLWLTTMQGNIRIEFSVSDFTK